MSARSGSPGMAKSAWLTAAIVVNVGTAVVNLAALALAADPPPVPPGPVSLVPRPCEAADRQTVVIVVGAAGEAEYGKEFYRWAAIWEEAVRRGGAELIRIGQRDAEEGGQADGPADGPQAETEGKADGGDRERMKAALEKVTGSSREPLWIVLIGHGTFDGREAKFNLRGPDITASELAGWLRPCERPLAVINCASASGPFINALSGENRVVATATKSGFEYSYARFGGHLAAAIAAGEDDIDKDGQVSLLEAFLVASARTAEFYEEGARLATEHALIDDNGDGLGTPAEWFRGIRVVRRTEKGAVPDGPRSHQLVLVRGPADRAMPPEVRLRRDELELALARLREEKESLDAETYYARLEPIALELARLYASLGRSEGPSPEEAPGSLDAKAE